MRNKKFLASAVLTTMAVMQLAMPVLAAQTNNQLKKEDNSTEYTAEELLANGNTTFGVFESNENVTNTQVSFEVPLYVTMAAANGKDKFVTPKEGDYYIGNTVANPETNPIGVVGLKVEKATGSKWSVETDADNVTDNHHFRFTLGKYKFTEELDSKDKNETIEFYKYANWDTDGLVNGESSDFVLKEGDGVVTTQGSGAELKQIKDKLAISLDSEIKLTQDREKTQTSNVFKVIYTVAMVDPATGKPMASTYVGDDKVGATEYYNWSSVQ